MNKKVLAVILGVVLVLALAGAFVVYCNSLDNAPKATEAPVAAAPAAEEAPAASAADAGNDPYADPYKQGGDDPYKQGGNDPYADPYKQGGAAAPAAAAEATAAPAAEYIPVPGEGAKYTVEVTADGWVKIVNDGGDTLGLSKTSGVKIVEADGYAFKDLNQNGQLDAYEDWRLESDIRAQDLVASMEPLDRALILSHGGWGNFTTEPLTPDDGSYTYLMAGGRGGVTRNIAQGGTAHAKWTNAIQEVAESCYYGIPAMISIDPANISGLVECVGLASTMDTELAAQIGIETAKEYRAAGVTALLGPQVDISSPNMDRAGGTYGEDPLLTKEITVAYVNGMQSTYDAEGNDLGWGDESVFCFTKHYGGAGATEGGRNDHHVSAVYAVFPGNNLEAHLITYFDGVFQLPGKTKSSGIMTQYSINVDGNGEPYGPEEISGAYNPYMYGMLKLAGYDSLTITDWGVYTFAGVWGAEGYPEAGRIARSWAAGANLLGGYGTQAMIPDAYTCLGTLVGTKEADAILSKAAYNYIKVMMDLNMFDLPYTDTAKGDELCYSAKSNEFGTQTQQKSAVMIKNNGVIKAAAEGAAKPTVYIPMTTDTGASIAWIGGVNPGDPEHPTAKDAFDMTVMNEKFNVVTDTVGEDGVIVRATAEQIKDCDYILVGMKAPYWVSYYSNYQSAFGYQAALASNTLFTPDDVWYPASLQYGEYTATAAREKSISGLKQEDGTRQNRSYKDQTAPKVANYGDLEALTYAKSIAGDKPVIVAMSMERGMVWSEVEPMADAIIVTYNKKYEDVVADIVLGKVEPNGLLVFQQPINMDAVETQYEDVPRDMECYVDANGNAYDFAFGMNWSGVINDARVEKYSAAPITKLEAFDYAAYEAANK